jgi:hypothetical protein
MTDEGYVRGISVVPRGSPLDSYLMRFLDGEARGDYVVKFPWPLPDRVVYFPQTGAIVDYAAEAKSGGPMEWPDDMGLVHYRKMAESELPDSADKLTHVMRGAQYQEIT